MPKRTLSLSLALLCLTLATTPALADHHPPRCGVGLMPIDQNGLPGDFCPLENTEVRAHVAGFLSRVTVKQRFRNVSLSKIEAIYTFPLPEHAAVDQMLMTIGDRRVIGTVKEREEARRIYEEAKAKGHVTARLDQERPNIFTQSVANIEPGAVVEIELSYVETLPFDEGQFTFSFPMVVGPRYIPGGNGQPAPHQARHKSPEVPDSDKIVPPFAAKGTRAGHDIDLEVVLSNGPSPIWDLTSKLHDINTTTRRDGATVVTLRRQDEIPNRDFILTYRASANELGHSVFTHQDGRGSWMSLVLQPPQKVTPKQCTPRELVFVIDSSGSMSGFPIEKAKEVIARLIDTMNPQDTFNLITFAGHTSILWDGPRANTPQNRAVAQEFLLNLQGGGGTEMMTAIRTALTQRESDVGAKPVKPIRVVCFLTDGYVGNDMAIIDEVRRNADTTRVFSFGIGNSINRYLLDGMAAAGRGDVEVVTLVDEADKAVTRFHERILAPVLTNIEIDWNNVPVEEVYPRQIPDVFSAKPIVVHAKLSGPASGAIRVKGVNGNGACSYEVELAEAARKGNDSVPVLWARKKVDDLMHRDLHGAQTGNFPEHLKRQVIDLGTGYQLVTQFTSFVAVEETTITRDGKPVTVHVPVEMPEGVKHETTLGLRGATLGYAGTAIQPAASPAPGGMRPGLGNLGRKGGSGGMRRQEAEEVDRGDPRDKLATALRDLAKRVDEKGRRGNLSEHGIVVTTWRINIRLTLAAPLSPEQRKLLHTAGFLLKTQAQGDAVYDGSIDVRRLDKLVELAFVKRVEPR